MAMIPSLSLDEVEAWENRIQDDHVKKVNDGKREKLLPALLDRLGDLLTHQKHYLNINLSQRRDWQILRFWKNIVGREQEHIMQQLIKYPLFCDYANFLLGRSYKNFINYLQTTKLTNGEVDEVARWQALQLTVVSSRSVEDNDGSTYIGYNVICEIKADETMMPDNPSEIRSRSWVACKRFREFRDLYLKVKDVHRALSRLPFPPRTFVKSDTNELVVAERRRVLNIFLQGIMNWVKEESPWVKGDTVTREWIQVTDALETFLSVSEMALLYPKQNIQPNTDKDYALHPSVRDENWFKFLVTKEEKELFLSQTRMSLQGLSYIFDTKSEIRTVDLIGVVSDPDEFVAFIKSLTGCKNLTKLYLGDMVVGNDVSEPIEALNNLISHKDCCIELLLLSGWNIGDKLRDFSSSLSRSIHLKVLDLSNCGIKDIQTGFVELCSVLRNTPLKELYLDDNPFGDDGAKLLSLSLRQNPELEVLSLKFCKITPFGITNILDALDGATKQDVSASINTNLEKLYIADMSMEGENYDIMKDLAIQCSSMIEHNSSLRELDLSGHYFDTECGMIIMRSLQNNRSLKKLNISYSKRNWHSDQLLLEFFQSNQSIASLHLRNHMLAPENDTDAPLPEHLAYSIPNDDVLQEFFAWNMREQVFNLLCNGLKSNTMITLLDLQTMQLTPTTVNYINEVFKDNRTIQELLLRSSPELDLSALFITLCKSKLEALTIINLTREQGLLFIESLKRFESIHNLTRVSLSFINGGIELDIWDQIDELLNH